MQSYVECFSALMGGGKSFSAVQRMAAHIARGGVVYSNIQLKLDPWFNDSYDMKEFRIPVCPLLEKIGYVPECKKETVPVAGRVPVIEKNKKGVDCYVYNSAGAIYYLRRRLHWNYQNGQFNYLRDEWVNATLPSRLPSGAVDRPVLVVLDEALDHFENEGTNTNAEFRSFLRHVRKLGLNLIFIAQDFSALEKKIRSLTHYVWTFRDLKTWKVPVIGAILPGGTLPPPWNDNIQQRQFHQKQYGLIKAEPINRKQYAYREPLVFQCYQSVSLHNSKINMAGVAHDYGDSGRIKRKGKKVSIYERIVLYGLILSIGYMSYKTANRGPVVVEKPITSVATVSSDPKKPEKDTYERNSHGEIVERLPISWYESDDKIRYFIQGREIVVGDLWERGTVEHVEKDMICFRDSSDQLRWIIHTPPTVSACVPLSSSKDNPPNPVL